MDIRTAQLEVHRTAVEHGWWQSDRIRTFGDLIALCHSELSEALEAYRDTGDLGLEEASAAPLHADGLNKPEGIDVELADVVIRIMDMCGWYGINLENAIKVKMAYNKTRPMRHGGKAI